MAEINLKQPGLTYSACGTFSKNKERIQKFMQAGNTDYIYKNGLGKACKYNLYYKNGLGKACFQYGLWKIQRFG